MGIAAVGQANKLDFKEIKRIQEMMKTIRQLQDLRKTLEQVKDLRRQQEMIRHVLEEQKDQFWREKSPSREELELLREKTGYDEKLWAEIVRELLGEPPPKEV